MKSRLSIALLFFLFTTVMLVGLAFISRAYISSALTENDESSAVLSSPSRAPDLPDEDPTYKLRVLRAYDNTLMIFIPCAVLFNCVCAYWFSGLVISPIERRLAVLRDMLSDVGHELRTPITIALSNVQALVFDAENNRINPDRVAACERALDRMNTLVEDLLFLAKSEDCQFVASTKQINLDDLLRSVHEDFAAKAAEKQIHLTHISGNAVVDCDPVGIERAVANLVENAIRYSDAGATVTTRVERLGERVRVEVRDTGIGIAPEQQLRIFDRFYRVDQSRSRHQGGAGLGLSIVKAIAEAHKGQVSVQSELNRGSTFVIELPA